MIDTKQLKDEELKQVSGGTSETIEPSDYLFSFVITFDGVQCLQRTEYGYVDVLCYIKSGTTIYVLSNESLGYVKCTFTQDGKIYTGFIDEKFILDTHQ